VLLLPQAVDWEFEEDAQDNDLNIQPSLLLLPLLSLAAVNLPPPSPFPRLLIGSLRRMLRTMISTWAAAMKRSSMMTQACARR
jgi:hypothetical protein